LLTCTFVVAVFPSAVAVIIVSPSPIGLTTPLSSTTAIAGFADVYFATAVLSPTVRFPSRQTASNCCREFGPVSGTSDGINARSAAEAAVISDKNKPSDATIRIMEGTGRVISFRRGGPQLLTQGGRARPAFREQCRPRREPGPGQSDASSHSRGP